MSATQQVDYLVHRLPGLLDQFGHGQEKRGILAQEFRPFSAVLPVNNRIL